MKTPHTLSSLLPLLSSPSPSSPLRPWMKAGGVALLLAGGLGLASLSGGMVVAGAVAAEDAKTGGQRALAVTVARLKVQDWSNSLTTSGGLYPWQEAIVASELGGLAISELPVDVGSVVRRGQVLAVLNASTVRASLAQQQAGVLRARATLAEAESQAGRAQRLKDSGALSEQQIQQTVFARQAAQAALAAAEALQHSDELRLQQTVIRAVDDGVISARQATLGAVVQPGGELFRLLRKGRIEWRAELTAEQLTLLRPGLKARLRLSDGQYVEGRLRQLSPTLDVRSRKALAYVDLVQPGAARAGMFAQGEIFLGRKEAWTVPNSALLLRDGSSYVFEVVTGNRVEIRKVQTGRHVGEAVEILSGLAKEAQVVTRGAAFLNSGDPVQVVADLPADQEKRRAAP